MMLSKEERSKALGMLDKLLEHIDTSGDRTFNENEMTIANTKIKELTEKYGISLDDLKKVEKKGFFVEKIEINTYELYPRMWIRNLSGIIAYFYDCRCVRVSGKFYFIGFDLDAKAASEVFLRLRKLIKMTSKVLAINNEIDFSYGVVISLDRRLVQIKKEREKEIESTALVLVKTDIVNEEVKKMFPYLKTQKKVKIEYSDDFYRGIEYGKNIEIFKSVE